jgi:hypothetical protein
MVAPHQSMPKIVLPQEQHSQLEGIELVNVFSIELQQPVTSKILLH